MTNAHFGLNRVMYKGLELMYESKIINEMTENVIDYIDSRKDMLLPFDSIFEDKNRVVIPLIIDEMASKIMSALKKVRNFSGVDFDTGEVIREIQLDQKYGGGKKYQKVKIGKAIQSLELPQEEKQAYLDWLARYAGEMSKVKSYIEGHNYAVILSRAPVDIVRMSDHRNISSCHSSGGSYFGCAVQEAITGGAIAYLIHKDSLDNVSDEELQEADLFKDSDRGIRGIEPPLARIRIRRVTNDDETIEYAFPELRAYGDTTIPGFYASVRDFLKSKQSIDKNELSKIERNNYFRLRGGSYEDNSVKDLIERYFDHDIENAPYIYHSSSDASDERDAALEVNYTGFAEELTQYHYMIRRMDHGSVSYDYNDDEPGNHYVMAWGIQTYDLSDMNILDYFLATEFYADDMDQAKKGRFGQEWAIFVSELEELVDGSKFSLEILTLGTDGQGYLTITFKSSDGESLFNSEDYGTFVQEMVDLDNDHDDFAYAIQRSAVNAGFVNTGSHSIYSRYKEFIEDVDDYSNRYRYISLNLEDSSVDITTDNSMELLVPLQQNGRLTTDAIGLMMNHVHTKSTSLDTAAKTILKSLMSHNFDPQADHENTQTELPLNENVNSKTFDFKLKSNTRVLHTGEVEFDIHYITPNTIENIAFEFADYFDHMWPHLCNCIKLYILNSWMYGQQNKEEYKRVYFPKNYYQLMHIYGKYLN